MSDPTINHCSAKIVHRASDGYRAEVGYSSMSAPKDRPQEALIGAFVELSRVLHLFGFGEQAMLAARAAGSRVASSRGRRHVDDTGRIDWLLPIVTGSSGADDRTMALAVCLAQGLDGREAIDKAMGDAS